MTNDLQRLIEARTAERDALIRAINAEADALALDLATAPDRGGMTGPKGQRRTAWSLAHAAMAALARAHAQEAGL